MEQTSDIHCSQIIKKWDANWFHYATEKCPLKVKNVYDLDYRYVPEYCLYHREPYEVWNWTEIPEDWHDHTLCRWWGPGIVNGATGHQVDWKPEIPTGVAGVTVSFTTDDYANSPSPAVCGNTVNDSTLVRTIQMYAYEAVAHMATNGKVTGFTDSGAVYESSGATAYAYQSLAQPQIDAVALVLNNHAYDDLDAYASATWWVTTNPVEAILSSNGSLQVSTDADANGHLKAACHDNDLLDGGSVTVGFNIGPVVTIGLSFGLEDEAGLAGLGFAFDSDILGSDTDDKLELVSRAELMGDPITWTERNYRYVTPEAVLSGPKGANSEAVAVLQGRVEAKCFISFTEAHAMSSGGIEFFMGTPTYSPGTFTQDPQW